MNLTRAISIFNSFQLPAKEVSFVAKIDPRAFIFVSFAFILSILTLPIDNPEKIIWFAIYPIIMSPLSGQTYGKIFRMSFSVLPFIIFIGIFNPIFDRREAFKIGDVIVTYGWLSFLTIIIRGLLSMQALLLLIRTTGFINICNSLNSLGVPKILTIQLLLLYRYIALLMQEVDTIHKAIQSRGYGKKAFHLNVWVSLVGSLLIRTYEKSRRVYFAMISRGFNGAFHSTTKLKWRQADSIFCIAWIVLFVFLHFFDGNFLIF